MKHVDCTMTRASTRPQLLSRYEFWRNVNWKQHPSPPRVAIPLRLRGGTPTPTPSLRGPLVIAVGVLVEAAALRLPTLLFHPFPHFFFLPLPQHTTLVATQGRLSPPPPVVGRDCVGTASSSRTLHCRGGHLSSLPLPSLCFLA
jgi:hypothetical protein